jgi:hypothetical protein
MSPRLRWVALTAAAAAVLWLLHLLGVRWPFLVLMLGGAFLLVILLPYFGVRGLDRIEAAAREYRWRKEEGRHHALDGVSLVIEDDGRHLWIESRGVQNLLRTQDRQDVLAARHAGQWRRDDQGLLWLRVDGLVERLKTMPGRDEPHNIRIRRYFERDVLFPAERKRQMGR